MLSHVLHFITPDTSDLFQTGFFLVILAVAVTTLVSVWKQARPASWEANWEGTGRGTAGLALDVDHGSFNDVCDAVATKPEKYADIVPGILLIFGLLGTFIGLGIALDSASSILTNANAQGALDGGMKDLMAMMGGLGTKFKTSTWGILGFLVLKLSLSAMGRESQRQQWVIARMKGEMDRTRQASEQLEEARSQQLQAALADVATRADLSFDQRLQEDRGLRLAHHAESMEQDRQLRTESARVMAAEMTRALSQVFQEQQAASDRQSIALEQMVQLLDKGNEAARETQVLLADFTGSQRAFSDAIKESATKMSAAASSMDGAADDMARVITAFEQSMKKTLSGIEQGLGGAIGTMGDSLRENLGSMSALLQSTSDTLQGSLDAFTISTDRTLGRVTASIDDASASQAKSMYEFRETTGDVQALVRTNVESIGSIAGKISSSLSSVASCGHDIRMLAERMQIGADADAADRTELLKALKEDRSAREMHALLEQMSTGLNEGRQQSQALLHRQTQALEAVRAHLEKLESRMPLAEVELAS